MKHVEVPAEFFEFANGWYDGSASMLYAIASTGNLTIGSQRPYSYITDEEWQVMLFDSLDVELSQLHRQLKKNKQTSFLHVDICRRFQEWAEITAAELRQEYGLSDDFDDAYDSEVFN